MKKYDEMDISIKVVVDRGGHKFGPGTSRLLAEIDRCGSVRHAAEAMDISYGKTWKMIRDVEEALGEPVVERQQGGPHGGSASVTEAGHALIERYDKVVDEIRKYAEQKFRDTFD